jgi:CheY-like chemotaxis protein
MAKRTKKILLVEDNNVVRELLALFMTRFRYKILEAATGLEAIRLTFTAQPDLIMVDIRLPGMNGAEATARLKANSASPARPYSLCRRYRNKACS